MVNKFLSQANKKLTVFWAAGLLAGATLVSSMLGLLRERLILANFGVGAEVDAYKVAFTIPDFMFFILVSGALSVTFIPVFSERLHKYNKKSAWELSSSLVNLLAIITFFSSILIIIFAEPLVKYIVAPGLDEQTTFLAVSMMRIIAINPFLFSISSVFTSIQQAVGRFFFYSLAPSLYSMGIIIGVVFLSPHYGIMGVAYGVVIGSIIQLLISTLGLVGLDFDYRSKIFWKNHGFRQVLRLLPPRSLDQGMDYFNNMVETNLASRLSAGAITAYQTAYTLHMVPVTLIGVAISTAAFPQMSERLAQGRPDLLKKELQKIVRVIIWLAMPVAVITYFTRGYLVRLLVATGNPVISSLVGFLVISIFFRALYQIVSRSFYVHQDTKIPLYISFGAISLNIILAITLAHPGMYGVLGLAIAQSVVACVEVVILFIVLSIKYVNLFDAKMCGILWRMVSASGLTMFVTYFMVLLFPLKAKDAGFFSLVPKFGFIVLISLASYVVFSQIFRIDEAKIVVKKISDFVFKAMGLA